MSKDSNKEAARVVRETTRDDERFPADVEAAWETWINGIKGIDERARALLRAAFEAGAEAAAGGTASELGRRGGLKGGKARAVSLSPERRREIAKVAAAKRWAKDDD